MYFSGIHCYWIIFISVVAPEHLASIEVLSLSNRYVCELPLGNVHQDERQDDGCY